MVAAVAVVAVVVAAAEVAAEVVVVPDMEVPLHSHQSSGAPRKTHTSLRECAHVCLGCVCKLSHKRTRVHEQKEGVRNTSVFLEIPATRTAEYNTILHNQWNVTSLRMLVRENMCVYVCLCSPSVCVRTLSGQGSLSMDQPSRSFWLKASTC